MPEIQYDSKENIPEGLGEFAKEVDGKYVVNVAPQAKLKEFRDKNTDLMREKEQLEGANQRYVSIIGDDPDEFSTTLVGLKDLAQQVEDGKLKKSDAVTREVENRVKENKEQSQAQMAEFARRAEEAENVASVATKELEKSIVNSAIRDAVLKPESGMKPEAITDIMMRAREVWTLNKEGVPVAKKGEDVLYGADGVNPLTPIEWLKKLSVEAPHLSIQSSGGGANGGSGKDKYGGFSKEEFQKLPAQKRLQLARQHDL